MVDKFKSILSRIKQEKGPVNLFMIMKMDELTDKWSVFLAAPWISSDNKSEIFNYVRTLLLESLTTEESSTIARLGIGDEKSDLVRIVSSATRVENGAEVRLSNTKINGYQVHDAFIFVAIPPNP